MMSHYVGRFDGESVGTKVALIEVEVIQSFRSHGAPPLNR
jgi:hypothetical protein